MPHRVIPQVTHGRLVRSWNMHRGQGSPIVSHAAAKPSDKTEALNQINSWSSSPGASRRTENCICRRLRRGRTQGTHRTEQKCNEKPAAATDYHRKENRQDGAASVGFMRARQPDAVADERPNAGYQSATNRDNLQRTSRALRK